MALGNWPVASLRKRAVYKTEFDIFKQNTDIDLISLVSYDEHESDLRQIASKAGHKEQEEFNKHRKNFEQINRNKVRIAYDPNNKYNRTSGRQEREFKPNIWNKGDSSIYKAFARTSKTFLKNRTYGRNTDRSRTCYSAIEVRKPTNETVRSQSTCSNRPNERNKIKGGRINKSDVSNIETKQNAVNRNLNKQGVSTNRTSWRAKSAPTAPPHNNLHYSRIQDKAGYSTREKSAKLSTRTESNNLECKQRLEKCGTKLFIDEDDIKQAVRIQGPPREQIVSFVEEECLDNGIDNISVDNTALEECSRNNQFSEGHVRECENDYEKQSGNTDVKSDITEKNSTIHYTEDHSKSTHLVNVVDDPLESKDSGFDSNTVTPELELRKLTKECEERTSRKHVKFVFDVNESCENSSVVDGCSVVSENGLSDNISVSSIDSTTENEETTTYDVNTLISDLERLGANSRLSVVSAGCHSIYSHDGGNDSLCGENASKVSEEVKITKEETEVKENEEIQQTADDLETLNMSKEARHAILETLQDMGVKPDKRNREIDLRDIKHKSVNVQRKQKDNRSKYEFYMRERTKSFYKQQFRSMDSVGNEDNSSRYSSPTNARECDDSTSDELHKGKLFPTIKEMKKPSIGPKPSTQTKQIVTLENVRHKKHKIPGIGNYHMIASPDSDFEITPPGFDVRYNRPIISNEEMEIPPRFIRERSIQKCKNWLKRNINLSPLSLQPAKKS